MHVVELFDSLLQAPHGEVIEAALPETRERFVATGKGQVQLSGGPAVFAAQASRDALFQDLNDSRGRSFRGFTDEKVDVLGHDNESDQGEAVAVAHLAEQLDEDISRADRA